MDAAALSADLVFVISLCTIMWLGRNRTTLADDTLMGSAFWGYVVWSVAAGAGRCRRSSSC